MALAQPATVDGDTILVQPGTYFEQIDFLGKEVELRSVAGAPRTIIDGGRAGTTVKVMNGEGPLTLIEGFTITGGFGEPGQGVNRIGGGLLLVSSAVTLRNDVFFDNEALLGGGLVVLNGKLRVIGTTFMDNRATIGAPGSFEDGDGGAIYAAEDSDLFIANSIFRDNTAGGIPLNTAARGGAIFMSASSLDLRTSVFAGNLATCNLSGGHALGGALHATDQAVVRIWKTDFRDNIALSDLSRGGALYLDVAQLNVQNSSFDDNVAGDFLQVYDSEGGAIYTTGATEAFVKSTWFRYNTGQTLGGAVFGFGTYSDCEFIGNEARDGGAAYAPAFDALYFHECRFMGNKTTWAALENMNGGAIWGPAVLMECGLFDNLAHGKGGAAYGAFLYQCRLDGNVTVPLGYPADIYGGGAHDCWLFECVVSNNQAIGDRSMQVLSYGGGVSSSYLLSCEVWGNVADFGGGATNCNMDRVTLNANVANVTGGGAWFSDVQFGPNFLLNSIVWNNLPNEIHDAAGAPIVNYTDVFGGWPGLGNAFSDPFWYDEAAHDYYLLPGSPCIDAGDPTVLDPDGSVADMGAHPFDPAH
jgi:hypothetical protein